MKLIRCTTHPDQLTDLLDALESFDILNLTVTGGAERPRRRITSTYRGCEYKVRTVPTSIVDITASNDTVDDIVRAITNVCCIGPDLADGHIFIMPVEEWYTVTRRRVA